MHDLVIKGGSVVDGTGAAARSADVAITDGVITDVGKVDGAARESGPGRFDGQAAADRSVPEDGER